MRPTKYYKVYSAEGTAIVVAQTDDDEKFFCRENGFDGPNIRYGLEDYLTKYPGSEIREMSKEEFDGGCENWQQTLPHPPASLSQVED